MDAFVQWLAANHWFIVVGGVCTMSAIPLGFYAIFITFRLNRTKRPYFTVRSNRNITATKVAIPRLAVTFQGHDGAIENLTISKLSFWNAGTETIKRDDNVGLEIHSTETFKLLDARIIQQTTIENRFRVELVEVEGNNPKVTLEFDYVDRNEGVVVQLIHTGSASADVFLKGRIIGAGCPVLRYPVRRVKLRERSLRKAFPLIVGSSATLFFIIGMLQLGLYFFYPSGPESNSFFLINGLLYLPTSIFMGIMVNTIPRIPRGLDMYFDD